MVCIVSQKNRVHQQISNPIAEVRVQPSLHCPKGKTIKVFGITARCRMGHFICNLDLRLTQDPLDHITCMTIKKLDGINILA